MNEKEFSDFIKDRYEDQLRWHNRKSASNKKNYDISQAIIIVCSALTPALILVPEPNLKVFAVATSVIVAVSTGFVAKFKMHEKWTSYRTMTEAMRREYSLYKTGVGKYSTEDDRQALFVESIEGLLSSGVEDWRSLQEKR